MLLNNLEFTQSLDISDYKLFISELTSELGQSFQRSLYNWCKLKERPYPLVDWQIFIVKENSIPVGICSHYRQPEDLLNRYWIGWIGTLRKYRRIGIGSAMLGFIEKRLFNEYRAKEAWVYTENTEAILFYEINGYRKAGLFNDTGLRQDAAVNASIILKKIIS